MANYKKPNNKIMFDSDQLNWFVDVVNRVNCGFYKFDTVQLLFTRYLYLCFSSQG